MALGASLGLGAAGALLASLLLCLLSLDAVEQTQYGLVYNWVTKSFRDEVYHGGTHLIGFWNRFVVFPATVQTIEFSGRPPAQVHQEMLHTRTKEGLGLHLSISFQYTLDPDRLHELFALTNLRYEALYTRIARDQLLEAASEYEGPQYWLQRQAIGDHMRRLVDQQLRKHCAALWGLQLLVIDLPDRYEQSITLTQVQQQLIKTRRNQQAAASIRADTEVMRAEFMRKVAVTQADAQANYTLKTRLAEAEAAQRKISTEADTLRYVREKLKLSPAAVVEYQELAAYSGLVNATFLANLPKASAVVGAGFAAAAAGSVSMAQVASAAPRAPAAADGTPAVEAPGRSSGAFLSKVSPVVRPGQDMEESILDFFHEPSEGQAAASH